MADGRGGRRPDPAVDAAILNATAELLGERGVTRHYTQDDLEDDVDDRDRSEPVVVGTRGPAQLGGRRSPGGDPPAELPHRPPQDRSPVQAGPPPLRAPFPRSQPTTGRAAALRPGS